jgi:hypothetical protein
MCHLRRLRHMILILVRCIILQPGLVLQGHIVGCVCGMGQGQV